MISINDIFNESYYLEIHQEVAQLVAKGDLASGLEHFKAVGIDEGLPFTPLIDLNHYKGFANPTLSRLTNREALTHLLEVGIEEGLIFSPLIDLDFYKEANPDLANLSNADALIHLRDVGLDEGLQFSPFIDLEDYRVLPSLSLSQVFTHLATSCMSESLLLVLAPPLSRVQKKLKLETRPELRAGGGRRNTNLSSQTLELSRREKENFSVLASQ